MGYVDKSLLATLQCVHGGILSEVKVLSNTYSFSRRVFELILLLFERE